MSREEKMMKKRAAILGAAVKTYSENGFAETTISAIAKEAGVSFGSVFTYFATKEVLFEAAILEPLEEIKPYFSEIEERYSGSPKEMVKSMIDCQLDVFARNKDFLRLSQQVLARPDRYPVLFTELSAFVDVFAERIYPVIERGQKEGDFYEGSPVLIAQSYISLINGLRLTFVDDHTNLIWNNMKIQALRLFGPVTEGWGSQ
ncbi:TetR/AcrR family transcriptional regulator [Rossellomorea sp. YZS02]|uniref:TetR/AcrR family transcriptional regulator n=1 Tax=Rossellomorea sp. YZS02 TaxID=3097358 RepID=UPI002A14BDE4|nr:TetR/AcrR family transcriptional regulator [Rossellomorea sp. YZS02]MDX8342654.1 TetR/AcrR family transcriptional regulator [Rossellomorea sp. YZS02]